MTNLVSIIVPVYNCKPYLEDCIQSVLAQDYGNLELLLIDDGSTDGSGQICDQYAYYDKPVSYTHLDVYKRQSPYRPLKISEHIIIKQFLYSIQREQRTT